MQRHRHQEFFLRFLNAIERTVPAGKVVHVIPNNYATHKHAKVLRLGRYPASCSTTRRPRAPSGMRSPTSHSCPPRLCV
jgi:hypothetical protein